MPSTIFSASLFGCECRAIEVEVDILNGPASITIVGLGDASVQESKERIRSAIKNSGAEYPRKKKIINLAPAHIPKHGPLYDLPIALGLLTESKQIPSDVLRHCLVIGELALSGEVRKISGVLPVVHFAAQHGYKKAIIPEANASEASLVSGIEIIPAQSLQRIIAYLKGNEEIQPIECGYIDHAATQEYPWKFEDIQGHEYVKRALTIAAAGGHHVFLYGPPGSGKTILARSMQSVLPQLSFEEAIEVTTIYSIGGNLEQENPLIKYTPFRAVHHTASTVSLIGGGSIPKPGEVSLAHCGVLFLDELLEFPRSVLDVLRQPLEDGIAYISRARGSTRFPSRCILIASTNPCPCGFADDPVKACTCKPSELQKYRKKLSGPLMDRIDLECYVPRLSHEKLHGADVDVQSVAVTETSGAVAKLVMRARQVQRERYDNHSYKKVRGLLTNAHMPTAMVRKFCILKQEAVNLLSQAFRTWHYSGRAYYRILKVARTIADLEGTANIEVHHLAEALQYRPRFGQKNG